MGHAPGDFPIPFLGAPLGVGSPKLRPEKVAGMNPEQVGGPQPLGRRLAAEDGGHLEINHLEPPLPPIVGTIETLSHSDQLTQHSAASASSALDPGLSSLLLEQPLDPVAPISAAL